MSGPTPRWLWKYATQCLRLAAYFQEPGDGRQTPQIPAQALVWGLVIGHILREAANDAAPEVGVRVIRALARRLRAAEQEIEDLALRTVPARLAALLL